MSKNIVVKIMEERLSEYGFQYEKYEAFRWTFSREVKEIKQYVVIQKDFWVEVLISWKSTHLLRARV